jgi:hypothetical protein
MHDRGTVTTTGLASLPPTLGTMAMNAAKTTLAAVMEVVMIALRCVLATSAWR